MIKTKITVCSVCEKVPFLKVAGCTYNSSTIVKVSAEIEFRLKNLVDSSLEISALENIYEEKTRLVKKEYNPLHVLLNIVGNITDRLDNAVEILKRNRDFIQQNYINVTHNTNINSSQCCVSRDLRFDARFNLVEEYKTCFTTAGVSSMDLDTFYQKNLDNSALLLWQYFGDSDGNYHQYPWKARQSVCSSTKTKDHRFKDWYVFTASPKKKNVVIVVDESGSMSIPNGGFKHPNTTLRVDIAKDAARTVLETFSPTDHVGVVGFSNEPRSPSGCHGSKVARATVENKKIIHQFLDSIKPKKDTYYGKAFRSAFGLLREAKQQTPDQFENSLDMILFLTDGTPSESNINSILEEIVQGQSSLNNTVKIFVYGFGQEILNSKYQSKTDLLLKIADQNNQNMSSMFGISGGKHLQWPQLSNLKDTSKPIGPVGNLTILPDVDTEQLRNVMGSYYTKFPMSKHTDYSISLPHIEDKLGLVTTLGIPTLDKGGNFFGVAGIDLSLLLMFYEVVHFRQGQHGYGFVVGNNGKILVHPYMSNPQQQMKQPRFYDVDQIEPVLSDEAVFNITNGLPGHFYSKIATFWKTPDIQGTKPATFYYRPILRFHGNYSVVLVIFDEDIEELRADEDIEKGEFPSFIYHRMDLYDNNTLNNSDFCTRDNSVVLKNNATVKFAPSVYSNPVKSLEYEQNNKNRSYPFYQHYRNARLFSKNADIHQSASNDIVLTNITDQVWTKDDMIWRYLGTENGFFKIFPGTMLSDIHYDPRDDIWYRKAAENPDKYIFIDMGTPQQNTSSYVTMAKVFYQTSNGSVSGVVAADMGRRQFSTILTNMMTSCLHCYIVDDAGYVIGKANASMDLIRTHITEVAGPVSFLLMKQGFLKPEVCMDATSGVKRLTYRLDLGLKWLSIRKAGCHDYTLMTINNTNLYLLNYQQDYCFSLDVGTCNCQEKCLLCNNQMDSMCQCPCTCVNRTTDNCNSTFTMTQGYAPCRESLRHWKTVKTINLHQSNISECQPQCPSLQTEKDCLLVSGCTWCATGFYNHIPICTGTCPQDRMEIYMKTPCLNLTEYSHLSISLEVQKLLQSTVNDSNFDISPPMIIKQDMINFTISTKDRTSIPNSWTELLADSFYTKDKIVLINQLTMNEFTLLRLTLAFNDVNFTKEFETELTLRDYIDVQVKEFISQDLNDGNVTVSNVWPEQNEISCMLNTTSNKTVLMQHIQTWNISTLPSIDVFGRKLSLVNISVEHSYNSLCPVSCHQIDDQYECNKVPGCHWDVYSQGICTNNSLIPERIKATVSLPCLGLYSNQTFSEDDVIKQFNDLLMNDIPSLDKTMMQLSMVQDNTLIGRQIMVVLQGRVTSLPVLEIWWNIQQLIEGRQNVSVNGIGYHIMVHPVTYQQFTNMYISLTVDGFDADSLIQDHPLDGREEIRHAVIEVAKSYLRPQIVKSIGDFKFIMDEVTFSVDSSYDNSIDLRSEYDILQKAVTNGKVNVTVFDQAYDVKYVFFIGSFDHLCPRRCDEGTQSTCSIIPGCDWSNTGQCLSDVVFPERKTVNVVLPCIDIRKLSDPEKNYLLSKTTQYFTKYLKTKTLSTVVTSVHHQKDSPNHIVINLQATSRSPPLSVLYKDTEQWLKDKTLDLSFNNYTLLGRSSNDFTSISVALEFSNINFTELSIYKRMDWIKEISSRLKLILSDGISVDNEWLTLNYSIFDIRKSNNISYHIDLDKDLEKIQTFINLGGLTFHSQSTPITPHNILTNGNIDCHICNLTTQICKMERKCFLQGKWDVKFCNAIKNPDKFTYEVLLPCNQTQTLTVDEKKESEKILYNKVLQLLHPAGQHIINSVHIQQKGVTIKLQTSPLYPYLERYAETLQQQVDFRTGFNFGPQNKTTVLVPRHAEDFTNVEITLDFKSIDFDAIVNSGLASYSQISSLLNRRINFFMLGEIVQTYQVRTVEKDYIMFSLKKRYDSHIELSREITKLKNLVDAGVFDIDINYIRLVTATRMSVQGTFDELCDNLAAQSTGPVIYTLPTVASNASIHQIPVAMIPVPSILVLYNRSTASIPSLQTVIDTMYVDVCFIEMKKSPVTMESFSWNTCSFNTPLKDNTIKTERSNPDYIGPVQWTIIGVGGIFILALALWAIQGIHEMSKKNKSEESAPQNCSIEDTE